MQQTDLHCELTGLSVLRGLSGKPEPACLKTESDSELLSTTLKSLTISSMTGISESLYNTGTLVQHCDFACTDILHMQACASECVQLHAHSHTQMKHMQTQGLDAQRVLDTFPAFGLSKAQPKNLYAKHAFIKIEEHLTSH